MSEQLPIPAPGIVNEPLLAEGRFGVHVIQNPAGTFSFSGSVPPQLSASVYPTYEAGYLAFVDWFCALNAQNRESYYPNLRADVKAHVDARLPEFHKK